MHLHIDKSNMVNGTSLVFAQASTFELPFDLYGFILLVLSTLYEIYESDHVLVLSLGIKLLFMVKLSCTEPKHILYSPTLSNILTCV